MNRRHAPLWIAIASVLAAGDGCMVEPTPVLELAHFPGDGLEGLVSRDGVAFDADVSSDGKGSLRIDATGPTTVRLFETGDIDIESARLVYEARLRTQDAAGPVYLEMWCDLPGMGEYFSRALMAPLTGTNEWASQQTPFFLQQGQNPQNVRLNLVIEGAGTVWIDDIRVLAGPL